MQNYIQQGQIQPQIPYVAAPSQNSPMPAQNPNYAGVNIQIFNPMVGTPNGYIYPTQTGSAYDAGTQGGCYPSNYYTTGGYSGMPGAMPPTAGRVPGYYDQSGSFHPTIPGAPALGPNGEQGYYDQNGVFHPANAQPGAQALGPNGEPGYYDQNGVFHPANGQTGAQALGPNGEPGYYDQNGVFHPANQNSEGGQSGTSTGMPQSGDGTTATDPTGAKDNDGKTDAADNPEKGETNAPTGTPQNGEGANSPVDDSNNGDKTDNTAQADNKDNSGQASGKADDSKNDDKTDSTKGDDANSAGDKNSETNTTNNNNNNTNNTNSGDCSDGKKTEKRKVVELTDNYIRTLENYLNSQDSKVRQMGAKEVVNRLTEDDSRQDDPALTALVNKMLQDPSPSIRAIALSLVESGTVLGNDYTVNVLKKMQNSKDGFGQDSIQATSALLRMAGKTVEREFEVKDKPKKDSCDKDKK